MQNWKMNWLCRMWLLIENNSPLLLINVCIYLCLANAKRRILKTVLSRRAYPEYVVHKMLARSIVRSIAQHTYKTCSPLVEGLSIYEVWIGEPWRPFLFFTYQTGGGKIRGHIWIVPIRNLVRTKIAQLIYKKKTFNSQLADI